MTAQNTAPKKKRAPAKKKELAPVSNTSPAVVETPASGIMNALTKAIEAGKLAPEQLSMMLDAQERILDRQAKQEYAADMAMCQGEIPRALRNKRNDQTESMYEDLESLNNAIKPTYTKYGFAVSFNSTETNREGYIAMQAIVSHRSGWSEKHYIELPLDSAGIKGSINKTPMHATSSSRSYARRYLLREIFNITTSEDIDDDGNAAGNTAPVMMLNDNEIANLRAMLDEVKLSEAEFLRIGKYNSMEEIPQHRYHAAVSTLERRRAAL